MSQRPDCYLVRFGELALKKRNRDRFVDDLVRILKPRLKPIEGKIELRHKKMIVHTDADPAEVRDAFRTVFGISGISPIWRTSHEMPAINQLAWDLLSPHANSGKSFAIRARRAFKRFPHKSPELERLVASEVLRRDLNLPVNLTKPDLTLGISIETHETWIWLETWPGLGGLPVCGYNNHGLLLSGGIDSPVAGNLIQKRGGSLSAIYFHTPPYTVPAAEEKVIDLAEVLASYQNGLNLYTVNFTQAMQTLRGESDPRFTVVLSRRLMMRVATKILEGEGGKSIITGESLGQVASQTIENMAVIGEGVTLPILRPLIGMDKTEITRKAKAIGTYDISIRPFDDCCSLFSPKNPVTKANLAHVHRLEAKLPLDDLVAQSVENTQKSRLRVF